MRPVGMVAIELKWGGITFVPPERLLTMKINPYTYRGGAGLAIIVVSMRLTFRRAVQGCDLGVLVSTDIKQCPIRRCCLALGQKLGARSVLPALRILCGVLRRSFRGRGATRGRLTCAAGLGRSLPRSPRCGRF